MKILSNFGSSLQFQNYLAVSFAVLELVQLLVICCQLDHLCQSRGPLLRWWRDITFSCLKHRHVLSSYRKRRHSQNGLSFLPRWPLFRQRRNQTDKSILWFFSYCRFSHFRGEGLRVSRTVIYRQLPPRWLINFICKTNSQIFLSCI